MGYSIIFFDGPCFVLATLESYFHSARYSKAAS